MILIMQKNILTYILLSILMLSFACHLEEDNLNKDHSKVTVDLIDNGAEISVIGGNIKDFGIIKKDEKVDLEFVIKNIGDGDLRIMDVDPSCGCTAAQWPKDKDIEPGNFESITITFDSKGRDIGHQKKTVTLFSNTQPVVLIIRGEIK